MSMIEEGLVWIGVLIAAAWVVWAWLRIRSLTRKRELEQPSGTSDFGGAEPPAHRSSLDLEARADAARQVAEAEAARRAATQDAQQRGHEAEEARQAAQRAQAEARLAAEQEAARREQLERERARQAAQAEAEAERLAAQQETLRREQEAERFRLAARAEAARLVAEQETLRREQEAERFRLAAQAEAARLVAEQETLRREQEAERFRLAAQAEAARLAAQAEAARLAAQAEADRMAAAQAEQAAQLDSEVAAPVVPAAPIPAAGRPACAEATLVMVADDSKVVRVKTSRLLAQHGYRVVLAEDGTEAARKIEAEPPHALITDVDMPGMDGFELTRLVRTNPLTAGIPVIMITAANDRHAALAQAAGVSVLLGKPYPEEQLIAHLATVHANCAAAA